MARCVALALLAIIGGAAAGGYGAPDMPEPPPPAEPYGDEIIAVDPPPPPEPEPTEPPPPPPTEPPPPPPTEPPPPPPTEPPPPPPIEPPMPDPEPAGGYMEEPPPPPPEPEPTEPPPPPPTEPPPPPPTEPPPPPPPADEEPGYSDTMPMDTLIDDVELSEVATYGSVAPDGRKVLKKFKRTFKLAKPSIRDSLLAFRPASKCRNTQRLCEWWASQGECFGTNKRLMRSGTRGCGRACGVCTPNRQEWRLRRHNAGVLRRRLAAKGRRVVFKRRRAANN